MKTLPLTLPLALLLLAAAPAPDRPPLVPVRDAIVAYHVVPSTAEPFDIGVVLRGGGSAIRVDLPDQSYLLATPDTHALVMVVPTQGTAIDLPWNDGPQGLFMLDRGMSFVRKAEATVAGQRCTLWDATLGTAHANLCVTPDGLVLRSVTADAQGRRNVIEAVAVRYQALQPESFFVPPGFDRLTAAPAPLPATPK